MFRDGGKRKKKEGVFFYGEEKGKGGGRKRPFPLLYKREPTRKREGEGGALKKGSLCLRVPFTFPAFSRGNSCGNLGGKRV